MNIQVSDNYNKDLDVILNNLDALDTYVYLAAKQVEIPNIIEINNLCEQLKINLRNIRDNYTLIKREENETGTTSL